MHKAISNGFVVPTPNFTMAVHLNLHFIRVCFYLQGSGHRVCGDGIYRLLREAHTHSYVSPPMHFPCTSSSDYIHRNNILVCVPNLSLRFLTDMFKQWRAIVLHPDRHPQCLALWKIVLRTAFIIYFNISVGSSIRYHIAVALAFVNTQWAIFTPTWRPPERIRFFLWNASHSERLTTWFRKVAGIIQPLDETV